MVRQFKPASSVCVNCAKRTPPQLYSPFRGFLFLAFQMFLASLGDGVDLFYVTGCGFAEMGPRCSVCQIELTVRF